MEDCVQDAEVEVGDGGGGPDDPCSVDQNVDAAECFLRARSRSATWRSMPRVPPVMTATRGLVVICFPIEFLDLTSCLVLWTVLLGDRDGLTCCSPAVQGCLAVPWRPRWEIDRVGPVEVGRGRHRFPPGCLVDLTAGVGEGGLDCTRAEQKVSGEVVALDHADEAIKQFPQLFAGRPVPPQ